MSKYHTFVSLWYNKNVRISIFTIHIYQGNLIITACDNCTQILLDDIENMIHDLNINTIHLEDGIKPPWEALERHERKYAQLNNKFRTHKSNKHKARELLETVNMDFYNNKLPLLQGIVKAKINTVDSLVTDGRDLEHKSDELIKKVDDIQAQLDEIIATLNKFGTSHESTKSALKKARAWLKEMHSLTSKFRDKAEYKTILNDCNGIMQYAANLSKTLESPDGAQNQLNDLNRRLADLEDIIIQVDIVNSKAEELNTENKKRIDNLTAILEAIDLDGKIGGIHGDIDSIEALKKKIIDLLDKTKSNYDMLENNGEYVYLMKELENRERHLRQSYPEMVKYLERVDKHVKALERNVTEYRK